MKHRITALISACAMAWAVPLTPAAAQSNYPSEKPIRLIVPYSPGGATDVIGRIVADNLGRALGQSVVVDNREGAGGNIGAAEAARATADGYTLLMGALTSHSVMATLEKDRLRYDLQKDLTPVGVVGSVPLVVVVTPALDVKNLDELVAMAKQKPNGLNFASSGAGAPQRMAMELFKQLNDVEIQYVAYRGSGPAMTDLVGGQVETMAETVPAAISFIKSERLRPLAVLTTERISMLPDVPTAKEQGYEGFNVASLFGVMAPTGTPNEVLEKLNASLREVLGQPEVQAKLLEQGVYAAPLSIPDSKTRLSQEIAQWAKVIEDGNITVN